MNIKILLERWFSNPVKFHDTPIWVNLWSPANGHPSTKRGSPHEIPKIYWMSKVRGHELLFTTGSKALVASETQWREKQTYLTSLNFDRKDISLLCCAMSRSLHFRLRKTWRHFHLETLLNTAHRALLAMKVALYKTLITITYNYYRSAALIRWI